MAVPPGSLAVMTEPWTAAYGSAKFLRAWAQQPGFRLLKQSDSVPPLIAAPFSEPAVSTYRIWAAPASTLDHPGGSHNAVGAAFPIGRPPLNCSFTSRSGGI
ncbi:DUF6368 family protein [Streptomyces sp. NPDC003300]|uniref:DUF6368 family protein n=1 Tax=unclassified Streptomyces TaxID=2593676 RepID=UPI0033A999BB